MVDRVWSDLLSRQASEFQLRVAKSKLQVKLGTMLLQEKFGLQKRIEGAKMIDSVCKRAMTLTALAGTSTSETQSAAEVLLELIHMLRHADILELFFSRQHIHSQLVQRSENLLKLLLTQQAITDEQL